MLTCGHFFAILLLVRNVGAWCNGNTWVSKTFVEGSSPSAPAKNFVQSVVIGLHIFVLQGAAAPHGACGLARGKGGTAHAGSCFNNIVIKMMYNDNTNTRLRFYASSVFPRHTAARTELKFWPRFIACDGFLSAGKRASAFDVF